MTKLMEKALAAIREWPTFRQEQAAELLLALDTIPSDGYAASPDELKAIDEALSELARGERASDAEVEAAFRHFRK